MGTAESVSVVEALPQVAQWLVAELRRFKRRDLVSQVKDLRVYGRCTYGSKCGTLYRVSPGEYRKPDAALFVVPAGFIFVMIGDDSIPLHVYKKQ